MAIQLEAGKEFEILLSGSAKHQSVCILMKKADKGHFTHQLPTGKAGNLLNKVRFVKWG